MKRLEDFEIERQPKFEKTQSRGSAMWGRAVLVVLAAVVAACGPMAGQQQQQLPHLGGAINLFSRYGYLSISMRVVPREDKDLTWIFREPTVDIFRDISLQESVETFSDVTTSGAHVFEGDFHMEFCDNLKQLLQAYFRDFTVERLDRPWRAFTASWSRNALARHMGINSSYVTGQHCYVLVRVARHRVSAKLGPKDPKLEPEEVVEQEVEKVKVGDAPSVNEFVRSYGSHYIASYVTGNSLYQVFVYTPPIYRTIKDRFKTRGITDLSNVELASYFSPWSAEHIGKIQVASGNATVEGWATEHLRINFYLFTYNSLLKLHENASLLRKLDSLLRNEALLQLNLRTLSPAFKDSVKREWFHEVMDNNLKLWEVNL
ncbi:torso-like protein isoform X3 [Cryptotermes secundus]|uniref:torso-like protein isoform X3 n=1 Tax=Cryptotermes secundus TaxID=105785 RepID=UPI001454C1C8|nr:torso-like protein isoform X3 [Cryptotermes secundus]